MKCYSAALRCPLYKEALRGSLLNKKLLKLRKLTTASLYDELGVQGRRKRERKKAEGTKQEAERETGREEVAMVSWDMASGDKKASVGRRL